MRALACMHMLVLASGQKGVGLWVAEALRLAEEQGVEWQPAVEWLLEELSQVDGLAVSYRFRKSRPALGAPMRKNRESAGTKLSTRSRSCSQANLTPLSWMWMYGCQLLHSGWATVPWKQVGRTLMSSMAE